MLTRPAERADFFKDIIYEQYVDKIWQRKQICGLVDVQHKAEDIRNNIKNYRIPTITAKELDSLMGFKYDKEFNLWINIPFSIEVNDNNVWTIRWGKEIRFKGKIETLWFLKTILKEINYD
jgi:hypothetical protein